MVTVMGQPGDVTPNTWTDGVGWTWFLNRRRPKWRAVAAVCVSAALAVIVAVGLALVVTQGLAIERGPVVEARVTGVRLDTRVPALIVEYLKPPRVVVEVGDFVESPEPKVGQIVLVQHAPDRPDLAVQVGASSWRGRAVLLGSAFCLITLYCIYAVTLLRRSLARQRGEMAT